MNLKPFIASTAAAAVLAGGALASATVSLFSPATDDAIQLVPEQAIAYGNFFLDPSVDQQLQLKELLAKFPEVPTTAAAKARIVQLLDEGLSEVGMSFTADIEPWLGKQIAFFVTFPGIGGTPGGAALIASEDPDATQEAIDKVVAADPTEFIPSSYDGIDYFTSPDGRAAIGVVDDFMVVGTDDGFRQVADTRGGANLGDSPSFESAFSGLNEDRLAAFYLNPGPLLGAIPGGVPGMGALGLGAGATGTVLYVRGDAVVIESSTTIPPGPQGDAFRDVAGPAELMERLPSDAWAAVAMPAFGDTITTAMQSFLLAPGAGMGEAEAEFKRFTGLEMFDVIGWLGDTTLFVQGRDPASLQGGAVVRSTDPEASTAGLDPIREGLEASGLPGVRPLNLGSFEGFRVVVPGTPEAFFVIGADERLLAIYGEAAALAALGSDPTLGSTDGFRAAKAALGSDYQPAAYVDLQAAFRVIEAGGGLDGTYEARVRPFLDPLTFLTAGSRVEGDRAFARLVIGAR